MKKQSTLKRALALWHVGHYGRRYAGRLRRFCLPLRQQPLQKLHRLQPLRRNATTDSDKPLCWALSLTWYTTLNGNVSDNFANLG